MLEASVVIDIGLGARAVVRWYDDDVNSPEPRIYIYDEGGGDEEEPICVLTDEEWKALNRSVERAISALHGGL